MNLHRSIVLGLVLVLAGLAKAEEKTNKPAADPLAAWWEDLAGDDEGKIARATLALAAAPKKSLPLFRDKLRPVKVEPKRVSALLVKLDDDNFAEREAAFKELQYLGKYIKSDLEKALKGKPSPEVKKRVERLLEPINADSPAAEKPAKPVMRGNNVQVRNVNGNVQVWINGKQLDLTPRLIEKRGPSPLWLRAVRAAAILEHIGTPEARKVLETLAGGESDALPTKAAAEALERMKK
jgi:hypothetical protein